MEYIFMHIHYISRNSKWYTVTWISEEAYAFPEKQVFAFGAMDYNEGLSL